MSCSIIIETIDKDDNSKQIVQKNKWRPIYEVIDEDYIKKSNIFGLHWILLNFIKENRLMKIWILK